MMKGFMGKTHALCSVMLLCICMLIPIDFFKETIWLLKDDVLFFIVGIIVLVGGALLPDLDNSQSSAGSTLGPLGSICTIFMQSISTICWTLFHGKGDRHPNTPHRYFWHTLFISIILLCTFIFGIPSNNETILDNINKNTLQGFLQAQPIMLFFIVIIFMAVLVGSNMVIYRLIKMFSLPKALNLISPVGVIVYIFTIDYTHLRILGICIGMGYLFHCLEDFFADSGVPLLWPIPIRNQMWKRYRFIITCQTGGLINTIIDIIVLIIDISLITFIFLGGNL